MRLFASFAVLSLVPVLALGAILGSQYRAEVERRGVAQGRAQAEVVARILGEALLEGHDLQSGLRPNELSRVHGFAASEKRAGQLRRLRLRAPDQSVVFADTAAGAVAGPDAEAAEALTGESEAELTRLNSDAADSGPIGERVVEVYTPVRGAATGQVIGVLEVYLPYEPIAAELGAGLSRLYRALGLGLGVLYVVLAGLATWVTRRLARSAREYEHLALHDPLTGLPNRALFADRLSAAVATVRRQGGGAAVVLLDLDRFKEVNDTLGHASGDLLLRRLATRLRASVGEVDTIARLGGDEFGLVLAGTSSAEDVERALDRVVVAVEDEIELAGLPLSVEGSMGVALVPGDGDDAEQLLQRADVAMYMAKRAHARVAFYDPTHDHYNAERLSLVAELRRAIERNELVLHFQPQLRQPSGAVTTVEALVRWQHPTRGLLGPDRFLPVAEQTGLIHPLTEWVLDAALAEVGTYGEVAPDLVVAVNISGRSLQRPDFPQVVSAAMIRAGIAPTRLQLEITETALVTDGPRAAEVLGHLAAAGLRLSLDDFGQGFTSLAQLRHLPLSELKIDKAFVQHMPHSVKDAAIVQSVIELGHNLGMDVVAEGVETPQVLDAVRRLGCDVAQGYLFSKPLPSEALRTWLAERPVIAATA